MHHTMLVIVLFLSLASGVGASTERCVAFAPTHFDPTDGLFPDDQSLLADLAVLYGQGFRSVATYASDGTLNRIPRLAKELGFAEVFMGIYCPSDPGEVADAVAESLWVDGYIVGNEGLADPRTYCPYDTTELGPVMEQVREATGRPVTTCEQIDDYLAGGYADWLLEQCDWILANAHPFWAGLRDPQEAVDWTVAKYETLVGLTAKEVYLRETGLPSAGCDDCSESRQADFYRLLDETTAAFHYFEAFDQPWKDADPVEAHWGINDANREPKETGLWLPAVRSSWGAIKAGHR